jgi:hypothetical protein
VIPLSSWKPKKSLYAAGADLMCEMLGARDTYQSDNEGWIQAGSTVGTFVRKCTLYSRANDKILADGTGIGAGEYLGHNASLKKADKRAKVAAVLDWLSLRDLFTQDVEDGRDLPLVPNPEPAANAPKANTRQERGTESELGKLFAAYKACKPPDEHNKETLAKWAGNVLSRTFENVLRAEEWTANEIKRCFSALEDGR